MALQDYLGVKGLYNSQQSSHHLRTDAWDVVGRHQDTGEVGSVSVTIFMTTGKVLIQGSLYMVFTSLGLHKVAMMIENPNMKKALPKPITLGFSSDDEIIRVKKGGMKAAVNKDESDTEDEANPDKRSDPAKIVEIEYEKSNEAAKKDEKGSGKAKIGEEGSVRNEKEQAKKGSGESDKKVKSKKDEVDAELISTSNKTIERMEDAMLLMKDSFENALETSNNIQIKTQKDLEFVRSQVEAISADLKLLPRGRKLSSPASPGAAALSEWSVDPDIPPGSITQKMNRIEKGNESKNEKIKVVIQTVKSVANNLKESMELMIADTKATKKIIKESLKVQNKTLEAVKEINSKTELNNDTSTTEIVEAPVVEEELVASKDKGVILTSPIGKNMNKERLEQATDSDIEIVPTYHLENKAGARDPDKRLVAMSEKPVNKKTSWVGIAVGTNDITDLPNEWADQKEVLESCKKQTEFLVQSAKTMVSQHNVDVFVFEHQHNNTNQWQGYGGW